MFKKTILLLAAIILLAATTIYITSPPKTMPILLAPLPIASSTIVIPLDDRPPCTKFVSDLGLLASTKIILPPKPLLGNYNQPAQREMLQNWLLNNSQDAATNIIASDLLIHGGLIGSRIPIGTTEDEKKFLNFIETLHQKSTGTKFYVYSIIPRLLIADQLIPDSWWQWHLMRWAALQDIQDTFGDPVSFRELQNYVEEIPPEIIGKYTTLYGNNNKFNQLLLDTALKNNFEMVVIGQDDGQPFGLPNRNRNHALFYLEHNNLLERYHTTRGADELGCLLLSADSNRKWQYKPNVYVEYSSPRIADMTMPFMSCSVGETVFEKINIIGGKTVDSPEMADFILFVHCGDEFTTNLTDSAERLKTLVADEIPVALVDLSTNYDASETLFPHLISNDTPIVRLAAFAGWNTVSNSIGTAVAQASIFTGQKQRLPSSELPSLYALNLKFNLERFFDDWVYQKTLHHKTSKLLKIREIDPCFLGYDQEKVGLFIKNELMGYKNILFRTNLCRYPFYQDAEKKYYLSAIDLDLTLPWERIFEIQLTIKPAFGTIPATNP